jgi:hypothetical protein
MSENVETIVFAVACPITAIVLCIAVLCILRPVIILIKDQLSTAKPCDRYAWWFILSILFLLVLSSASIAIVQFFINVCGVFADPSCIDWAGTGSMLTAFIALPAIVIAFLGTKIGESLSDRLIEIVERGYLADRPGAAENAPGNANP